MAEALPTTWPNAPFVHVRPPQTSPANLSKLLQDAHEFCGGGVFGFLDAFCSFGGGVAMAPDLVACLDPEVVHALAGGGWLSLVASRETQLAWEDARARHHPGGRNARGHANGTLQALAACAAFTLVCQREGCGLLVHWMAARRVARAKGRTFFMPGDGCSGPLCSKHSRHARVKASQRSMAAAVRSWPRRVIIEWPEGLDAEAVWLLSAEAGRAAAAAALAAVPALTRPRLRIVCPCDISR